MKRLALPFTALAALLLAALVAACGPGVGGTGTGPTPGLIAFGAAPAPVCGTDIASALACPATPTGAPAPQGTDRVLLSDDAAAARITAIASGNGIELEARCAGLSFVGEWGTAPGLAGGRYFGTTAFGVPAALSVQPADGALVLQLRGVDGALLFGPVRLQRVTTLPPAAPC